MPRDAARNLLAAWKSGRPGELEAELERAACACRVPAGYPADEGERGELLAAIVEEMRTGEQDGAGVCERLLTHLAGPCVPVQIPNSYAFLC